MARRVRPAWVMSGALVIAAAGFALLTQVEATSGLGLIVAGSVIFSIGVAPVVTLGTDMIVGAAPAEQAGAASAISETGTELGLALGVAIIGSLGTAVYRGQLTDTVPGATPPDAVTEGARRWAARWRPPSGSPTRSASNCWTRHARRSPRRCSWPQRPAPWSRSASRSSPPSCCRERGQGPSRSRSLDRERLRDPAVAEARPSPGCEAQTRGADACCCHDVHER
jgi:hypothetical protein